MSDSEVSAKPLRWWPALVLVVLVLGVPYLRDLFESPSLPVMMIAFMGPGLIALVIPLWWLFASRASLVEKVIGILALLACATLSIWYSDKTITGMATVINVVPSSAIAFAVPLIVLASRHAVRLPVALLCAALTFAFWGLLRFDGVDGSFKGSFDWRWIPTAEEKYLAEKGNAIGNVENLPAIDVASAEWPAFRGRSRDGKIANVRLSEDWKTNPPKNLWTVPIGPGWSSFSVAGQRLFTQEQRGDNEAVVCLDANSGKTIWAYQYPGRFWEAVAGAGPRATPTIADEGLFSLGANGVVACLDPRTGEVRWQKDLKLDSGREPPMWGFSSSPLVTQGLAIVHAGGKESKGILAYEATTGELKWSVPSGDHSYSSPQLATFDSITGLLMETNDGLQFLDPSDGRLIWEHAWPVKNYRALQPLVLGNSILVAATLGDGTRRISVKRNHEQWQVTEDWTSVDLKPDFNDFVEHKGFVYGYDGSILCCTDVATGKRKWKRGRYGNGQVLLLPDADQLLVASETGELVLLKTDCDQLVEKAKIKMIDGKTWNHPVVVKDRVFFRNAAQAACFELPVLSSKH